MEGEGRPGNGLPDSLENWIPLKPRPSEFIAEDTFREIFNHSRIGIYRTAPNGKIILANPALAKMLGYSSVEELYHRNLEENCYDSNYPRIAFKDKMERDGRVTGLESAWLRKDGSILYVRENARAIRDESGQILYYEGTVENITEGKRLTSRLAEGERQLRRLVESSRDIIALFNPAGEYLYFHGPSSLGLTSRDLYGKTPEYLYGEERGREIMARVGEVAETGKTLRAEMQLDLNGKAIWTSDEYYPIRDKRGDIIAVGKISHNITERREAEISLAESENRFKSMFMNAPLGYQSMDESGKFLYVNNKWLELTGYERDEVLEAHFTEFITAESAEKFNKYFDHLKSRGEIREVQFDLIRKDGSILAALFDGTIQHDGQGEFLRTHCIMQDITAKKKAEESLRRSEAKWRSLVQNAPNEIIIFDLDGKIRFSNRKSSFNRENAKPINSVFEYLPIESHELLWEKMESVLDSGSSESFEVHFLDSDGSDKWMVYCLGAVHEDGLLVSFIMIGSDITKRITAELSWRASEDRLRRVIESSGDVVIVQDLDGTFLYYHGPERYRIKPEDIVGKKPEEYTTPERAELYSRQNRIVIETGEACKAENKWEIDGKDIYFESEIFPLHDENGSIVALGRIARNITERKQAEELLTASEERFRAVFETAQDAIFIKDKNLVYTEVNPALQRLFKKDRSDIIGKDGFELFGPDVAHHIMEVDREVLGGKVLEEEYTVEIDGQSRTLHIVRVPMKDSSGDISGLCGIARDITERAAEQKKLLESEEKYRTLVDNLNIGVSLVDRNMHLVSFNRKLAKMYPALKSSDSKKCYELYYDPPRDKICENCPTTKAFSDGKIHEYTSQANVDGHPRVIRNVSTPVLDQQGNVIYVLEIVEDVTERMLMQEELSKAEKLDSIGILAGGIAHDFNNIMTAVMGNISLALSDLDPGSQVYRLISDAEQATSRAQSLTQQLLTFARGGRPIRKPTHLDRIIRESVRFALTGSSIKCVFSIPSDLHPAKIDKGQIGQVLHNLVINAVQAMPEGGRVNIVARNVTLKSENPLSLKPGRYIMFSVEDNGIGIPENKIRKIFDPFYTTKQRGSGLGLATSYSIIQNHEGYIGVDSRIGEGTRFDVYLPADGTPVPPEAEGEEIIIPHANGRARILIMDDESGVRKVARVTLEKLGYEVAEAEDGGTAEQTYRRALEENRTFDAVILDLTIPGGSGGKKTVENLRKLDPDVKAIVSSGYSNDPIMADYRDYGFLGRVAKPYRASELARVVAEIIRAGDNTDSEEELTDR